MVDKLDFEQIKLLLPNVNGWHISESCQFIEKIWDFETFPMAFSFMTRIAFLCEARQHYPEWSNVNTRVFIRLSTYACDGVSLKDIELAKEIDSILPVLKETA